MRSARALLLAALLFPLPAAAADPHEALQKAAALVQQGRLDEADAQARLALDDPDTRAVACSVLGTIRFRQHQLDESARLLQRAIALEPRLLGAHLTLAAVYEQQGQQARASEMFRRVLQLDPSNALARIALAREAVSKGRAQEALDLAAPAMPAFEQSPEGLFVLANAYVEQSNRGAAGALADKWIGIPNVPDASSMAFGLLLLKGKAVPEGIAVLEHVRQTGTPSYELFFNLGSAYLLRDDPTRALAAYDEALGLRPDSLPALRQAAATAEQHGELERSLSYWIRARKAAPDDPDILLGFGRVCLKMDLLDDAEPALEKAAVLKPGVPAFQYTLAAAKVGKRQFEDAQRLIEEMLAGRPHDARLQYAMGSILYTRGLLPDAETHLRESIRLQPNQLAAPYYLALVRRDLGHDDEAIVLLEGLLKKHPEHSASCEVLGGLLMTAQRYLEAEEYLRTAVRLNPDSVKATYQLGLLLARTGRKDEADAQLARARTLRKEDEENSRLQLRLLEAEP